MFTELLVAVSAIVVAVFGTAFYSLFVGTIHPFFSPLRDVPGPKSKGFLFGNLKEIMDADPSVLHDEWAKKYGKVFKYKAFMNRDRLTTTDTRAINHILAHPVDYQKPAPVRYALISTIGHGLLTAEGEMHRQQRRILNPAFGVSQIRELTDIFLDKSLQLRDIWMHKLASSELERKPDDSSAGLIEAMQWLNKMTLDIIGLAGFNYDLQTLDPTGVTSDLNQSIRVILSVMRPNLLNILHGLVPATRVLSTSRDREVKKARAVIDSIGLRFLEERKAAMRSLMLDKQLERKDFQGKDLFSLLVKANMATDLPEKSRLSDEEVLDQVPTFLLAGHETTSTAVTWILYALALNPSVQNKLRSELVACGDGDRPTMDTLNSMSYVDAVVRETLRLYAPVSNTLRVAMKDDIIPTEDEWVDKNGKIRSGIPVSKGDSVYIPILGLNRSQEIWGEDAAEFKPERWSNPPSAVASIPGIWGNVLSFSGGTRACIGYRFSVIEIKAIIYTLIRSFKFSLAVNPSDIKMKSTAVTRPFIKDKIEAGPQLPMWVSIVGDSEA